MKTLLVVLVLLSASIVAQADVVVSINTVGADSIMIIGNPFYFTITKVQNGVVKWTITRGLWDFTFMDPGEECVEYDAALFPRRAWGMAVGWTLVVWDDDYNTTVDTDLDLSIFQQESYVSVPGQGAIILQETTYRSPYWY